MCFYFYLTAITPHQINARYRKYNWKLIRKMRKSSFFQSIHGKQQKIAVAFDTTEIGYYGAEDAFTVYTKGRSPAKLCYSYLTLQIVCAGIRLILDVEPIYQDSKSLDKLMKKMLRRVKRLTGLKISTIYLDRGFYQTDILRYLKHNFTGRILMPVIRTSRVKKAIRKWYDQHGYTAGEMELVIGSKQNSLKYILIFSPLSEKERAKWRKKKKVDADNLEAIHNDFLYFCLLKPPELLHDGIQYSYEEFFKFLSHDYRNRWGIETGNRDFKTVLAKTTSRCYSLRYWLLWNAVLIYNQWVSENLTMMEEMAVPDNYTCCKRPTLQELDEEEKLKQSRKYPGWSRVTSHIPKRPWSAKPLETLNSLCGVLRTIATRELDRYIKNGCDPPPILIEKKKKHQ